MLNLYRAIDHNQWCANTTNNSKTMIGLKSVICINADILVAYANLNLLLKEAPENSPIMFALIQAREKTEELYRFLESLKNIKVEGGNLYTFDPNLANIPPRTYT